MGHTIKGQSPRTYRPSRGPMNTMARINERVLPFPPESPVGRRRILAVNNIGYNNLSASALLAILRASNLGNLYHTRPSLAVPNIGAPSARRNLSNIVARARANYKAAKTNENRKTVYAQFKKNHSKGLRALKARHMANLQELNNATKNVRLSRNLRGAVNALKKSLRGN
jgi:hypothetical protein